MLRASEQYGPLSRQTENQLKELDSMVDKLLTRMKKTRMDELVNFIIMSDHGMSYGNNPSIQQHSYPSFPFDKYEVHKVSMEAALRPVRNKVRMVIGEGAYAMVYPR